MGSLAALSGIIWYGGQLFLIVLFLGLSFYNLNRKRKIKATVFGVLFAVAAGFSLNGFISDEAYMKQLANQYSGFYKLEKLNRVECKNCRVRLNTNGSYDIFKGDSIIYKGKWEVGVSGEDGPFIDIDQLHGMMIWPSPRVIYDMNTNDLSKS